jgi:hypothetical protein
MQSLQPNNRFGFVRPENRQRPTETWLASSFSLLLRHLCAFSLRITCGQPGAILAILNTPNNALTIELKSTLLKHWLLRNPLTDFSRTYPTAGTTTSVLLSRTRSF